MLQEMGFEGVGFAVECRSRNPKPELYSALDPIIVFIVVPFFGLTKYIIRIL